MESLPIDSQLRVWERELLVEFFVVDSYLGIQEIDLQVGYLLFIFIWEYWKKILW